MEEEKKHRKLTAADFWKVESRQVGGKVPALHRKPTELAGA